MLRFLSLHWKKINKFKSSMAGLIFILALTCYFSFGLYHLTKFDTADEHYWIDQDRISQYWNALGKGDWKKTRINDKPGITLAYVSGIGLLFDKNHSAQINERGEVFTSYDNLEFQRINFYYRFPLLIFNGLFSLFFFWVIKKLTENVWIGLWSATLILLSPILLGVSQIVNPDSLSWLFCSATILSFLLFIKNASKKVLALTTLFLGLALATKYIALILVYFLFFIFIAYILYYYKFNEEEKSEFSKKIQKIATAYLAIIFGGFFVFALLMPAVFVKSKYLFKDIINFSHTGFLFWGMICFNIAIILDGYFWKSRITLFCLKYLNHFKRIIFKSIIVIVSGVSLFAFVSWATGINFFNLEAVPFDSRQSDFFISLAFWKKLILQSRPLVFSLTPLVLFGLFFIWLKVIFQKTKHDFLVFMLSAFILIYWLAVTMQNLLVNIRYGIILQPLVIFMAVLGIWEFLQYKIFLKINKIIFSLIILLSSIISLWSVQPFYFNYANIFLPRHNLITGAWGYGGYEAGQAITALAGGKEIIVIADYPGICPFITGQCVDISNDNKEKVVDVLNQKRDDVYFVLTRRGQVRWNYIGQFIAVMKKPPLWELNIDNRPGNFVRVYKQENAN
ncbi:MAG: phospholipid carrier-dependent glycosyltransferase [Candidatus Moraniibacteriota bacterium]